MIYIVFSGEVGLLFNKMSGCCSTSFFGDSYYQLNLPFLAFVEIDKLHAKPKSGCVVSDLAFQIEPISIRQQNTKSDYLSAPDLSDSVQIASTFRHVSDPGRVMSGGSVPNCVQAYT